MSHDGKSHSILLRLRRTTVEDGYVAVPLTDAVVKLTEEDALNVDAEALVREAIRLSADSRMEWRMENATTECHPIQGPKPDERTAFDAWCQGPDAVIR